jgi:rRNA pseudouridine-1189 N-methylase Emg1 (Nep1/Mra1 family)
MLIVLSDAELKLVPELLKEEEEVRKVLKRV